MFFASIIRVTLNTESDNVGLCFMASELAGSNVTIGTLLKTWSPWDGLLGVSTFQFDKKHRGGGIEGK